jgi:hypothetical protein
MLFRDIIAVCSENYIKPINTIPGKYLELLNIKAGDTHGYNWH